MKKPFRLILPLITVGLLSLPTSVLAEPDPYMLEAIVSARSGSSIGMMPIGRDPVSGSQNAVDTAPEAQLPDPNDAAYTQGGIVRPEADDRPIIQHNGGDMNDVENAHLVSWPFLLITLAMAALLAFVYFRLKKRGGFADHFGKPY